MKKRKVHIKSFGCQMNKLDTAMVSAALKESGYELVDESEQADVVLMNTCSVREHAEEKVFSHLGYLGHIKKTRPGLIVGVIGCMAQRLGSELLEHAAVDLICGPGQIPQTTKMLEKVINQKSREISVTERIRGPIDSLICEELENFESVYDSADKDLPNQAFVRIMRGCDNFCTYCIVPYVRGPEVSRPPGRIIEQIRRLTGEGIKQVTLLGQAVNKYRYDAGEKVYRLADMLESASEIDGIEWVKFVTNYPLADGYEEILEAMRDLPKVCEYLHMPAQSGSDRILQAMNRKYSRSQYLEMLGRAREIVPGISTAGDLIVGFPHESDEDFEQTVSLVRQAGYKNCFVFKYSPRPGTVGEKRLADDVPQEVKKQRNRRLLEVQKEVGEELSQKFLGKELPVLVEGLSKKPDKNRAESGYRQLVGRTAGDWIVVFNGSETLAGQFVKVRITKAQPLTLFAQLVGD